MKSLFLSMACMIIAAAGFAQSVKYSKAMQTNIAQLDSVMQKGNFTELANNFERIGDVEKGQWLPYYYAAYATAISTNMLQDKSKTDGVADKATVLIQKAETIAGKENSEICVIKSIIASAHLMVDPQSRWQQYGGQSTANIQKAKSLDPTNPRPYYLEGQAKYYTPVEFGGGKAPAMELLNKAMSMYGSFKPETPLYPTWGKEATQYFISMASK